MVYGLYLNKTIPIQMQQLDPPGIFLYSRATIVFLPHRRLVQWMGVRFAEGGIKERFFRPYSYRQ